MDRIFAPDRRSLSAHNFPAVPRLATLARALRQQQRYEESTGERQALAIIGDGGMGKSVLLGQLLDYLVDDHPRSAEHGVNISASAVVLVACSSISPMTELLTLRAADEAFGLAADPLGSSSSGVLGLLAALKAEHGAVTLLIDTLDLLINERNAQSLANLLAQSLAFGNVMMTCRSYEFRSYFGDVRHGAPRLVGRLVKADLPVLEGSEIVAWARVYLSSSERVQSGEEEGFISALQGGVAQNGSLRQVCAVPVRLAITCETFVTSGHVPEDLSVTELYDAYWDGRVHRQAGRSDTLASQAKEHAALSMASRLLTSVGTILVQMPKASIGTSDLPGLHLLVSEGVVRDLNTAWEFFHQTFAEYAYARWLLTNGVDSPEIAEVCRRIRAGQTSLWPIGGSLLLQVRSDSDYAALVDRLPVVGPEGARVHALASLRRSNGEALSRVLRVVERDPALMLAVLPALADAPAQHFEAAVNAVLGAIRDHPAELAGGGVAALATLLPRAVPAHLSGLLADALDTLMHVYRFLSTEARDYLPGSLLRPLVDLPVTTTLLPIMIERYAGLGVPGRLAAVRAHLGRPLTEDQTIHFGRVVVEVECPPLKNEELVQVMQLLWNCAPLRTMRGWQSWTDLLADNMGHGWNGAQIQYVLHCADEDLNIREQLLADLLSGQAQPAARYVNVFKQLARLHAQWIALWLLAREPADNSLALGAITQGAEGLTKGANSQTRSQLISWLTPGRPIAPRGVWAAQIILASDSVPTHQQIFDDLIASGEPKQVLDSALDAWLFQTPRHIVNELAGQFRTLLQAGDAETRRTRARLEGRLADEDEAARTWIEAEVQRGQSPRIAGTAIKTLADAVAANLETISPTMTTWLGTLLSTQHADAARRIAEMLADKRYVDDRSLISGAPDLVLAALKRLRVAARLGEDSQLSRALLQVVIRLDIISPVSPEMARDVYYVVVSRLTRSTTFLERRNIEDEASAIRDLAHLCGTIMSRRIPEQEIYTLIADALWTVDLDSLGNSAVKSISAMLIGLGYRDLDAIAWMEQLFADARTSQSVKRAIAEAVLRVDGDYVGGRASVLKDRPDCPQPVATYIIGRLRT